MSLQARVQAEDPSHLLDGVGIALRGMARPHDQLRLDPIEVSALVLHDTIVSLLDRPVSLNRDEGVHLDGGNDGDRRQDPG